MHGSFSEFFLHSSNPLSEKNLGGENDAPFNYSFSFAHLQGAHIKVETKVSNARISAASEWSHTPTELHAIESICSKLSAFTCYFPLFPVSLLLALIIINTVRWDLIRPPRGDCGGNSMRTNKGH